MQQRSSKDQMREKFERKVRETKTFINFNDIVESAQDWLEDNNPFNDENELNEWLDLIENQNKYDIEEFIKFEEQLN